MPIDFSTLSSTNLLDSEINPRKIFGLLPKKSTKINYPRDVQSEVWEKWFQRRNEAQTVIKMNTGSGKTLVGLVILKSCLNENNGPAIYITPDIYLTEQVIKEAAELGIEVTEDHESSRFLKSKAILVINVYKLVNGRSVFGVCNEGIKINIGSILFDDAHACISTIEAQFTIDIKKQSSLYDEIIEILLPSIRSHNESSALEIESMEPGKNYIVPFWIWIDHAPIIIKLMYKHKEDKELLYKWMFIKDILRFTHCVIGGGRIEISPYEIPLSMIPSISRSKRNIFMTATLSDDNILVSHFDFPPNSINNSITPSTANDIGDRLILFPMELNPTITNDVMKGLFVEFSLKFNVIVLVPSNSRAEYWSDVAKMTLRANNIHEGITKLQSNHIGLVVVVNKYDGIDLPKTACQVLVIDDVPDLRRKIDNIEQGILINSDYILSKTITRIEQGMGRGIRSSDDYCLVFLVGKNLTKYLCNDNGFSKFTKATKAQLTLSEKLSEQLHGKSISDIVEVCMKFLDRDPKWVSVSKEILVDVEYDTIGTVNNVSYHKKLAFNSALNNNIHEAMTHILKAIEETPVQSNIGWLKYLLAQYEHIVNPASAQATLISAIDSNNLLPKPRNGITYSRLNVSSLNQAAACIEIIKKFQKSNELIIEVESLLSNLIFKPDSANIFEENFKQLAVFLGFQGQRPESECGKGPDVLWEIGNLEYYVIECKNGAVTEFISKEYCNQLNGSAIWFENEYDNTATCIPILIHPSNIFEYASSPKSSIRIINEEKLSHLTSSVHKLYEYVNLKKGKNYDVVELNSWLEDLALSKRLFIDKFTVPFRIKK